MRTLALVASLVFLSVTSQAQNLDSVPNSSTNEAIQSSTSAYSVEKFDMSWAKLPLGYKGQDPLLIHGELSKRLEPKGEFETTQNFNDRRISALKGPLVGNLTSTDAFAAHGIMDKYNSTVEYDADKGLLNIRLRLSGYELILDKKEQNLGMYTAQNAFGVKVKVVQVYRELTYLKIENYKAFKFSDIDYSIKKSVPMGPEKAKYVKDRIGIMAIYNLKEPFVRLEDSTSRATLDNPEDTHYVNREIYCNLIDLWFYDLETGEVLVKIQSKRK